MKKMLEKSKNLTYTDTTVTVSPERCLPAPEIDAARR